LFFFSWAIFLEVFFSLNVNVVYLICDYFSVHVVLIECKLYLYRYTISQYWLRVCFVRLITDRQLWADYCLAIRRSTVWDVMSSQCGINCLATTPPSDDAAAAAAGHRYLMTRSCTSNVVVVINPHLATSTNRRRQTSVTWFFQRPRTRSVFHRAYSFILYQLQTNVANELYRLNIKCY